MRIIPSGSREAAALTDRLPSLESLVNVPRAEVEWLVAHGEFREYAAGEVVVTPADDVNELIVMLSGCTTVYFGQGGRRHAMESRAGTLTGILPFSRLKRAMADVFSDEMSVILAVNKSHFPELIRECPVLTESLVHIMIDRARRFAAVNWQDEKVLSLGRLAAGLAHELNNPASAALSAAKHLGRVMRSVGAAAHRVGMAELSAEQRAQITSIVERCHAPARGTKRSAVDRFDMIERTMVWLESHGASTECAPDLVDGGVDAATLDELARTLPAGALGPAIEWIASASASASVAADVEQATLRIHDVVSAVRNFTHMDRAAVREPTDIGQSIAHTVEVIRPKAREKGATLHVDVPTGLPKVNVVAADLNQAWFNLVENAVDAVDANGNVTICASAPDGVVVVEITDDGPGIPADVQPLIFDPFFTTKPVGKGTGLGLDIVRRVVRNYAGEVEFTSQPGRTSFRVRLPVDRIG